LSGRKKPENKTKNKEKRREGKIVKKEEEFLIRSLQLTFPPLSPPFQPTSLQLSFSLSFIDTFPSPSYNSIQFLFHSFLFHSLQIPIPFPQKCRFRKGKKVRWS
jgi:hypothetical protein